PTPHRDDRGREDARHPPEPHPYAAPPPALRAAIAPGDEEGHDHGHDNESARAKGDGAEDQQSALIVHRPNLPSRPPLPARRQTAPAPSPTLGRVSGLSHILIL